MKKLEVKILQENEWQLEGELVLKEGKIYIPKNKELRIEVIRLYYDVPVVEYGGRQKIMELVTRNYWWPGITKDVERYMDSCDICQRMKNRTETPAGKLMANKVPEKI